MFRRYTFGANRSHGKQLPGAGGRRAEHRLVADRRQPLCVVPQFLRLLALLCRPDTDHERAHLLPGRGDDVLLLGDQVFEPGLLAGRAAPMAFGYVWSAGQKERRTIVGDYFGDYWRHSRQTAPIALTAFEVSSDRDVARW